jgi:GST-like protein
MIDLYTWTTPNGRKASIMLEEVGLPYTVKAVNIGKDEQFTPEFLRVSPNNKIPAIVDHEAEGGPLAIFESGAILTYLADKSGQFLAPSGAARYRAMSWTYWQVGALGPMMGQLGYFSRQPERNEPAIARFAEESARLLHVLNDRLAQTPYLAGDDYSIADMATYPWISAFLSMMAQALPENVRTLPATARWLAAIGSRPAVQKGMALPE